MRRGDHEIEFPNLEYLPGTKANPETQAQRPQAAEQLHAATAALPRAQGTALRVATSEDLSLAEASTRSGMTIGALKVATHRAIAALRRHFEADTSF